MTDEPVDPLRHRIMAAVRGKDSKAEILVRSYLHRRGFRFRLHRGDLPGRPDIVLPRWRAAVFVHGCFWHRHAGCPKATTPTTRRDFWLEKFERNVARDAAAREALLAAGWRVAVVWECALSRRRMDPELERLEVWLRSEDGSFETTTPASM
jgi:DNA mismatch endonuclease (patch repair protein)